MPTCVTILVGEGYVRLASSSLCADCEQSTGVAALSSTISHRPQGGASGILDIPLRGLPSLACLPCVTQDAEAMAAERVQALAASGLWEAVNLPALREKPAEKPKAKPEGASTAVRRWRYPWGHVWLTLEAGAHNVLRSGLSIGQGQQHVCSLGRGFSHTLICTLRP